MTPEHAISGETSESQGSSNLLETWIPDGRGYGKPRALTGNSSGLPEATATNGCVFAREAQCNSLHSEPDMDTILPLPGSGGASAASCTHANSQMLNVVSPASSEEEVSTRIELVCVWGGGGGGGGLGLCELGH